jgi:GNAT superfamily N-acetyltransferase
MGDVAPSEDDAVLTPDAWSRVVSAWADQVGVSPQTMRTAGVHAVQREDLPALAVLKIRASTVVVGPFSALSAIAGLQPHELLSIPTLVDRLERCDPEPIGTATIAFRDSGFGGAPHEGVRCATADDANELRAAVAAEEWHEGGLDHASDLWAVATDDGTVAAIAGYEVWNGGIAQLGVAAHPAFRGRGFARAVAAVAITEAHEARLVVQWRSRNGNEPSQRLGASLGFVVVGQQSAVELRNPQP